MARSGRPPVGVNLQRFKSELLHLWDRGWTGAKLAKRYGCSRGKILGFVHRHNGEKRRTIVPKTNYSKPSKLQKEWNYAGKPRRLEETAVHPKLDNHGIGVAFLDTDARQCKYIREDGLCCGDPVSSKSKHKQYCEHHRKRCVPRTVVLYDWMFKPMARTFK